MLFKRVGTSKNRRTHIARTILEFAVFSSTTIHIETVFSGELMMDAFYSMVSNEIPESLEILVGFVCLHLAFKLLQGYDEQNRSLKIRHFQRFQYDTFSRKEFVRMEREILQTLNYRLFPYTQNLIPLDRWTRETTETDLRLYLVQLISSKIHVSMDYDACDESTKRYLIQESKGLVRFRKEKEKTEMIPPQ